VHSGQLAQKAQTKGRKTAELAQDILRKKLEGDQCDLTIHTHERLTKLFDAPIPQEAMEAIEDLLKAINLENKTGTAPPKSG
jgi:hypothetical protein